MPSTSQIERLIKAVHFVTGIDRDYILSPSRKQEIADARAILYHLMLYFLQMRVGQVAKYLRRDHSSVSTGAKKVANEIESNWVFAEMIQEIKDEYYKAANIT